MADNIILVGMMGSGKTTLGRFLSMILGLPFIDLDKEIELQIGKTIPQIFEEDGEEYFRNFECLILKNIISSGNAIISTGGGIIENIESREILKEQNKVFYLKTTPEILYSRIKGDSNRPNLKTFENFSNLLNSREAKYLEVAKHVVDVNKTISEIAQEVRGLLW